MAEEARQQAKQSISEAYRERMHLNITDSGYAALETVYGLANAEYYAGRDALHQARLSSGNQTSAWLSLAVTFFTRCQAHAAQVKEALVPPPTSPSDLGLRPFGGDWAEWETRIK
jgi:hypothetical protein